MTTAHLNRASAVGWIGLLARLVLGGALLLAGLLKIGKLDQSVLAVRAYQLLPWETAALVGYGLPVVEILLGTLILVGMFTRWTALLGVALMVVFIFGIAWAWSKGLSIDCGCFSDGGAVAANQTKYPQEIVRDLAFAACGVWLVGRPDTRWSVDRWLFAPLDDTLDIPSSTEENPINDTKESVR